MVETKKYDCGLCCNRKTPLCNSCSVITAPDGTVNRPRYFVRMSDEEIHVIEENGADMLENLALYIVRSVELGVPIPVALVMLWNRKVEK